MSKKNSAAEPKTVAAFKAAVRAETINETAAAIRHDIEQGTPRSQAIQNAFEKSNFDGEARNAALAQIDVPADSSETHSADSTLADWTAIPDRRSTSVSYDIVGHGGAPIASVYCHKNSPARAALIAAAPDLLVALEYAFESLNDAVDGGVLDKSPFYPIWQKARAAIAQARGASPRAKRETQTK